MFRDVMTAVTFLVAIPIVLAISSLWFGVVFTAVQAMTSAV